MGRTIHCWKIQQTRKGIYWIGASLGSTGKRGSCFGKNFQSTDSNERNFSREKEYQNLSCNHGKGITGWIRYTNTPFAKKQWDQKSPCLQLPQTRYQTGRIALWIIKEFCRPISLRNHSRNRSFPPNPRPTLKDGFSHSGRFEIWRIGATAGQKHRFA